MFRETWRSPNKIYKGVAGTMIAEDRIDLYKKLSMADAVAGREKEVREVISQYIDSAKLKINNDHFGNLYIQTHGNHQKKIMIAAHMDEVGFLVRYITEDGFLYLQPLGGWWGHVLLGQTVTVTARKNGNKYRGVIGTTFPRSTDPNKVIDPAMMYVDVGAPNKEAIMEAGIQPGDMITPYNQVERLTDQNYLMGKAWDDRICCGIMVSIMNHFANKVLNQYDIIGVGTAQEEVGTRGSKIAAEKIKPDIAIVLDVATAKDTPNADRFRNRVLGEGPGIVLYDKTALSHMVLADMIADVAKKNDLPFQFDMLSGGGTDAGSIHLNGKGIPTITLSLGIRYCHSGASIVHLEDAENLIRLLQYFIAELDQSKQEFLEVETD